MGPVRPAARSRSASCPPRHPATKRQHGMWELVPLRTNTTHKSSPAQPGNPTQVGAKRGRSGRAIRPRASCVTDAARPYYRTCPLITHDTYWCALVESMCDMRTAELDSWKVSMQSRINRSQRFPFHETVGFHRDGLGRFTKVRRRTSRYRGAVSWAQRV